MTAPQWPQYEDEPPTLIESALAFIEQSHVYAERAQRAAVDEYAPNFQYVTMSAAMSTMYAQQALIALALLSQKQEGPGLA